MVKEHAHALADAYGKLRWADAHIDLLISAINDVGEIPTRRADESDQLDHPYDHLFKVLVPEIPTRLAFIVADAVHNIRTSLDYLMSALASMSGHAERRPTFPICESEADLRKHRTLQWVDPAVASFIERHQPYNGRSSLLWLHRLDIIDKHRKLSVLQHGPPISVFVSRENDASSPGDWYLLPNYWIEEQSGTPRESIVALLQDMRAAAIDVLDDANNMILGNGAAG